MNRIVNQENLTQFAQQLADKIKEDVGAVVEEVMIQAINVGLRSKADAEHTHVELLNLNSPDVLTCNSIVINGVTITVGKNPPKNPKVGDIFIRI